MSSHTVQLVISNCDVFTYYKVTTDYLLAIASDTDVSPETSTDHKKYQQSHNTTGKVI